MKRLIAGIAVVVLLSGCTTSNVERKYTEMPEYVKEQPSLKPNITHNEGSLWNNTADNMFSDIKARQVGDIVTIIVKEQAQSVNSSSTKTSRATSSQSGLSTLLGMQGKILQRLNAVAGASNMMDTSSSSSFNGSGENKVNNELTATITARVVKVLPNHKLFIRGEKQVYTNGDENTIILTGIIDEYQITSDNTIDSNYISDAKIFYNGKGIVSSTRNEGWLTKLWNLLRPF
ncbi:flagellar basal body L-ring protein FlgH [Hippea maritima]|uniref:Flagellar L-ring protein n=1 Tax=Hippea maritima (strain ATCC 700847 / DSM 10411 / MH2) TaxID=760142 RepID=F2LY27_HIPMA|nr:flagellar basal body L-ring protein FlgH [Hippea maritima]AEA33292.1 Flagellar L-ring protein [Hippea maritima DSM 10411]